MAAPSWSLDVTERVHATREAEIWRFSLPGWILGASVEARPMDVALLRLRGRYAYARPGVEIQ